VWEGCLQVLVILEGTPGWPRPEAWRSAVVFSSGERNRTKERHVALKAMRIARFYTDFMADLSLIAPDSCSNLAGFWAIEVPAEVCFRR